MRMKTMNMLRAALEWMLAILEVRLPVDAMLGLRTR